MKSRGSHGSRSLPYLVVLQLIARPNGEKHRAEAVEQDKRNRVNSVKRVMLTGVSFNYEELAERARSPEARRRFGARLRRVRRAEDAPLKP